MILRTTTMGNSNVSGARQLAFRGFVRVNLDDLSFVHDSHRGLDERNVARICRIFELEGCQRLDEHHFVDVVIGHDQALDEHRVTERPIPHWPDLPLIVCGKLECLNGRHRIQAAKLHLPPNERWWIARVFIEGIAHMMRAPRLVLTALETCLDPNECVSPRTSTTRNRIPMVRYFTRSGRIPVNGRKSWSASGGQGLRRRKEKTYVSFCETSAMHKHSTQCSHGRDYGRP